MRGSHQLSALKASGFYGNEAKPLPNQSDARPELEVHDGDLLFTRKNTLDLVGAAAVVNNTSSRRMLPDTVFRLVPAKPASSSPEYLSTLINFTTFRPMIRQLASGSAASMPGISKGRLKKLRVPLPPLAQQMAFSDNVHRLEALARHLDAAAAKAEAMAASLSAEVFDQAAH
jgi:type I restriction enzyme, S subunit